MAKKILVIDDEPDIMAVATSRLRHLGYAVISAVSAEEALAFLENSTPDLILLDMLLPNIQGDELCRRLKTDGRLRKIPVVLFITSAISSAVPETLKRTGADDYLTRPCTPHDLLNKVKKFLA
jgi:CheY-like chemotaxis protein